jgi:hypothetical protein
MFSLFQTWKTTNEADYALLNLLGGEVQLSAAKYEGGWRNTTSVYVTANRNEVAASIAARAADSGLKTLLFAQDARACNSIQKKAQDLLSARKVTFNEEESSNFELAVMELGNSVHSYCIPGGLAACHHGDLLPIERQVNESLFRRQDGVDVMIATSTLAQGMNLPGQLVVIAGDDRFDSELEKMALLETHELLNAAGRAGRAGEAAEGMVILVPGKVIDYDVESRQIAKRWMDLQRQIFSNSDQCLELEDPVEAILDRVHEAASIQNEDDVYLLRRLPIKVGDAEDSTRRLLSATFAAFKKRIGGDQAWMTTRIESAIAARKKLSGLEDAVSWEDELAATTGILRADDIRSLAAMLKQTVGDPLGDISKWVNWGLSWLAENPHVVAHVIRPLTVKAVFGGNYTDYSADNDVARALVARVREAMPLWIEGAPLNRLDAFLTGREPNKCAAARDWALRFAPELAYFFGAVTQTYRRMSEIEIGKPPDLPLAFSVHGRCVREGFDDPAKLALHQAVGAVVPRVAIHRKWADIQEYFDGVGDYEKWQGVVEGVRKALRRHRWANGGKE